MISVLKLLSSFLYLVAVSAQEGAGPTCFLQEEYKVLVVMGYTNY